MGQRVCLCKYWWIRKFYTKSIYYLFTRAPSSPMLVNSEIVCQLDKWEIIEFDFNFIIYYFNYIIFKQKSDVVHIFIKAIYIFSLWIHDLHPVFFFLLVSWFLLIWMYHNILMKVYFYWLFMLLIFLSHFFWPLDFDYSNFFFKRSQNYQSFFFFRASRLCVMLRKTIPTVII